MMPSILVHRKYFRTNKEIKKKEKKEEKKLKLVVPFRFVLIVTRKRIYRKNRVLQKLIK